jgi:hypothetical protein
MLKLIDCPFCGAPDEGGVRVASEDSGELHVAYCPKCEAQGPHTKGTAGDAARAWNNATTEPRPMGEAPLNGEIFECHRINLKTGATELAGWLPASGGDEQSKEWPPECQEACPDCPPANPTKPRPMSEAPRDGTWFTASIDVAYDSGRACWEDTGGFPVELRRADGWIPTMSGGEES